MIFFFRLRNPLSSEIIKLERNLRVVARKSACLQIIILPFQTGNSKSLGMMLKSHSIHNADCESVTIYLIIFMSLF